MSTDSDGGTNRNSISFGHGDVRINVLSQGSSNTVNYTSIHPSPIDTEQRLAEIVTRFRYFLQTRLETGKAVPAPVDLPQDLITRFKLLARIFIQSDEHLSPDLKADLGAACAALGISDRWLDH